MPERSFLMCPIRPYNHAQHAIGQGPVVERLLLGIRRLLLHSLIAASHPADESTCPGTNGGPFAGIASDRASDGADRRTARGTAKGACSIWRGLGGGWVGL